MVMRTLRPDQVLAMDMLRQSLGSGKKRPMLQASVGFGKTIVSAEIAKSAWQKGKRVVFIADAISLIDQTIEKFFEQGCTDIGAIQANHYMTDYSRAVQVASIQTLMRRGLPDADLYIHDEAHILYQWWAEQMASERLKGIPCIGLSATPWSRGLGNHYDDLLRPTTMHRLLDQGSLKPNRVFAPSHPDLSKARTVAGDYHEDDIARIMGDDLLIADIVKTWKEKGDMRPTLAFCVNCDHAKQVQEAFIEAGIPWGYIDKDVDGDERKRIKGQLDRREIYGVSSVGTMTKGVDWLIGCIILARPTKSKMLLVQILGRGMRTDEFHDYCIVLDHTDSILRLGLPEDIDASISKMCTAQKGERTNLQQDREPAKPKECKICKTVIPPGADKCPTCGHILRVRGEVSIGDGELQELTGGREKSIDKRKTKPVDKERFYRELLGYAALKGKSESWTLAMFKNKFDEWPYRKQGVEPINPTPQTISYIRSRNIAYAKSKGRK